MIPPSFSDLGKAARDLFDKNFKFNTFHFDYKSKTSSGLDVHLNGANDTKTNKLTSYLETTLTTEHGLKLKTKVDTNWLLLADAELGDKVAKGLKHNLVATLDTDSGKKSVQWKNSYKRDYMNLSCDFDLKSLKPVITSSLVLGCSEGKGYLAGAQVSYDTGKMQLSKVVYSLGYVTKDITFHGALTNHTNWEGSVYQRLRDLEVGFTLGWVSSTRATNFGAALKYAVSPLSFFKVKVDQACMVGVAYCFQAVEDVQLTLCAQVDGKDLEAGGNRFGLSVEYGS